MHEPGAIAKAYLIESEVDYKVAVLLSGTEYHSRTIFLAQQAVEKMVKACLALRGIYTTDHNMSSLFKAVYGPELPGAAELVRDVDALERHAARVRFPLFQRPELPIWIPSHSYRGEDARRALQTATTVIDALRAYIDKALA
ncbi:MAG TPA: HEPN domain-containing protein [Candidatus Methylomirabilis sp.]|jgi:HEPN domain-containing protein